VKAYKIACKENCLVAAFNGTTQQVRWDPPCEGWVVLNIDRAKEADSFCGCGGIIRCSRGEWISDFSKGLGECSVEMAELWGAWVGLKLAWDLGHRQIDVRMDAQGVVKLLNKEVDAHSVG
jgi:ribonuclease HI